MRDQESPRCGRRSTRIYGPDPIDVHVGARVRLRRILQGFSQVELATRIGLTFQQVQKYERGTNRIAASMLHRIAGALDIPVSFFFDCLPDHQPTAHLDEPLLRHESLELIRYYYALPEMHRQRIYQLIKSMADDAG